MIFSISIAFKKLNQRQQNLNQIVFNIMIDFRSVLHFPMFPTTFDQRAIRFDPRYILKVLSKISFCLFQTFIKKELRTKRFDPSCLFKALSKFLTNSLFFFMFQILLRNLK